jgi:DNA-binding NarL/FixJ family response regulator
VRDLSRRARLGLAAADAAPSALLTAREAEVLALVAQGLTNRAVGQRLFISDKTVSVHLSNVMAKLGAASRTEAVSRAHRRGLLAAAGPAPDPALNTSTRPAPP